MTNLEINQAVYQAMCKIADKWFKFSVEKCEKLRGKMEEKPQISAKEFYVPAKGEYVSQWDIAKSEFDESTEFPEEIIEVGNFKCNVNADNLWPLMKAFQKLAKANDHIFTYEKESRLDFIAEEEIRFIPNNCKRLVDFVCKDKMYSQLTYIHVEYNVKTSALAFFVSDSHAVAVMATDDSIIAERDTENTISAHFTVSDWKRLCDASQKTKQPARFYIFPDAIEIGCGDVRIMSIKDQIAFPDCQRIMPDKSGMRHIALADDEIKPFQAWIKKVKLGEHVAINVSVYAGNKMMYVDILDFDCDTRTTKMFRLAETATETFGTAYNSDLLRTKPTGFWVAPNGFTYIEDAAFDKVLQMQYVRDVYTYDEQEREVHALAECA